MTVVPQAWITTALVAAGSVFGPVRDHGHKVKTIRVQVRPLPALGRAVPPNRIVLSPRALGIRERVECVLAHEYGHLARYGRGDPRWYEHSSNPRSIMYRNVGPATCHAWLASHT